MKWSKLYNPPMKAMLRSPLHGLISGMYMLVTFTGRKSGRVYSTPVEYVRDGDDVLFFTAGERVWWRNLRDGAPVTVRVQGRDIAGTAQAVLGDVDVFRPAFEAYLERFPGREKYFGVSRDADGSLNGDDIAQAANVHVTVRISPQ